jgi:hypothetical protein
MRFKEIKEAYEDNVWNNFLSKSNDLDTPDSPDRPTAPNKVSNDPSLGKSSSSLSQSKSTIGPTSSSSGQPTPNIGSNSSGSSQRKPASAISGSGSPSEQLINYIKHNEKFSPKAFWDYKQWTNGYGTKARSRNEVIDEKEADRRIRQKAQEYYDIVVRFDQTHKYGFNNNQRDALTSFVLNGGPGWLNQVSNNGRRSKEQIAKAMTEYNTAGGKRLGGLARRRREEVAMFSAGSNMA